MSDDPERPDRVNALRDQLRALGYLNARVDRFVLGGAVGSTRPVAFALAASLRIGMLAGVLLGPAAAIGLRSRAPGLITSTADAVVVAIYLAVFFGVAATLISALAVWLGAEAARKSHVGPDVPRRARRGALTAGLAVTLTCLAYLTLWWRTAAGLEPSLAWSLTVLAVAAAISLLLGHVVAVTVLALLARRGLGDWLPPGLPLSSPKTLMSLGVIALAGAVVLLVASAPIRDDSPPVPLTVVPTGLRTVVIAVDGVDVPTVDRLRAAGRLGVFNRLLGPNAATMPSDTDRDPARVWTTIATGQPPERHGIRALESRQVAGVGGRLRTESRFWSAIAAASDVLRLTRPAIASGDERLSPTFWEVAARAGLRTAVVHWWATWPVPETAGIVLSDRAILRLEHGGPLDGEIAPHELYDALRQMWPARRERAVARANVLAGLDASDIVASALRRSAELDATILDLASDPALAVSDLLVVYLPGLDIAQHALLGTADAAGLAPSAASERVTALERYYEFLDEAIGRLLETSRAEGRIVMLVTQPGRLAAPSHGLLALGGEAAGIGQSPATMTAVAPTVLYSLGVPVARDLASPPAMSLFTPAFVAAHPVRDVASYGPRRTTARPGAGKPLDKEMIERMRSLGYVR
jgi:Type I phosphodiesterase / nucleotide pyrophosphatase